MHRYCDDICTQNIAKGMRLQTKRAKAKQTNAEPQLDKFNVEKSSNERFSNESHEKKETSESLYRSNGANRSSTLEHKRPRVL